MLWWHKNIYNQEPVVYDYKTFFEFKIESHLVEVSTISKLANQMPKILVHAQKKTFIIMGPKYRSFELMLKHFYNHEPWYLLCSL